MKPASLDIAVGVAILKKNKNYLGLFTGVTGKPASGKTVTAL